LSLSISVNLTSESPTTTTVGPPHKWAWAELNLTVGEWAAIVAGVICLWIVLSFVLAYFLGPDFVKCYLCQQEIPRRYWESGEHRIECAQKNEKWLEELPSKR
jgi:hypothetical protein